ncbi:MAG: hypothetical protein KC543_00835 [Myxococcales bacterium]|nr:hypothetical protein [Myxococcales bacterium]
MSEVVSATDDGGCVIDLPSLEDRLTSAQFADVKARVRVRDNGTIAVTLHVPVIPPKGGGAESTIIIEPFRVRHYQAMSTGAVDGAAGLIELLALPEQRALVGEVAIIQDYWALEYASEIQLKKYHARLPGTSASAP